MASAAALQLWPQLAAAYLRNTTALSAAAAPVVLSPVSIWLALVLLVNAAGLSTPTFTELWAVVAGNHFGPGSGAALSDLNAQAAPLLGQTGRQAGPFNNLTIASALWTQGSAVDPAFAGNMASLFKAEVTSVAAAGSINEWAACVTSGAITEVVPADLSFSMVLTSALFFKGQWEHPFNPTYTKPQPFKALTPLAPTETQVSMMSKTFEPSEHGVLYSEVPDRYRALQLPYKGPPSGNSSAVLSPESGLVAIFVLPMEGIGILEAGQILVAPNAWSPLTERLAVSLPRFKLEVKQLSLTNALQSLGVLTAFTPATDFSRVSTASPLVLSDVLHSVAVQVDESFVEDAAAAAAAPASDSDDAGAGPEPKTLVFDRPFLFFIVDTVTQTVLLQGAVTDPTPSDASS